MGTKQVRALECSLWCLPVLHFFFFAFRFLVRCIFSLHHHPWTCPHREPLFNFFSDRVEHPPAVSKNCISLVSDTWYVVHPSQRGKSTFHPSRICGHEHYEFTLHRRWLPVYISKIRCLPGSLLSLTNQQQIVGSTSLLQTQRQRSPACDR